MIWINDFFINIRDFSFIFIRNFYNLNWKRWIIFGLRIILNYLSSFWRIKFSLRKILNYRSSCWNILIHKARTHLWFIIVLDINAFINVCNYHLQYFRISAIYMWLSIIRCMVIILKSNSLNFWRSIDLEWFFLVILHSLNLTLVVLI